MSDEPVLRVAPGVAVPLAELEYRATRSGGPGGQHVNTSSTRIELLWNVAASGALTEEQRERILRKLPNRIDQDGVLRVVASETRSQFQNRKLATERLVALLGEALRERKRRRPTRPSRAAKEARLRAKKRRSEKKKERARGRDEWA